MCRHVSMYCLRVSMSVFVCPCVGEHVVTLYGPVGQSIRLALWLSLSTAYRHALSLSLLSASFPLSFSLSLSAFLLLRPLQLSSNYEQFKMQLLRISEPNMAWQSLLHAAACGMCHVACDAGGQAHARNNPVYSTPSPLTPSLHSPPY